MTTAKFTCSVVGAKGYLGKHLVKTLKDAGHSVYEYDIIEHSDTNYQKIDLLDKESLRKIKLDVDFLFLFAGHTGTKVSFTKYEDFILTNELGLTHILDLIRSNPAKPHVVFPSTRLVYLGSESALDEDDTKENKTVYAANKNACEAYLHAYHSQFNLNFTVYRVCVPFGNLFDDQYSYGTIGFFLNQARSGRAITLYGDGKLKRTFSHVQDICDQILLSMDKKDALNKVFNIGGETFSLSEAAVMVAHKFGVQVDYIAWPEEDLKLESGSTYFKDDKIKSIIGDYKYRKLNKWIDEQ